MKKYYFLYKENNSNNRDCVKYLEVNRIGELECGHYFPSLNVTGACFSQSLNVSEMNLNEITSILTAEDFQLLDEYDNFVHNLGYGITKDDEKYLSGMKEFEKILSVIEKIKSKENEILFEKIQEEEKEYLAEEYSLNEEDVEEIFNNYGLDYRDRGIVSYIWDSIEEVAEEEAEQLGYVTEWNERYFNYEKFGEDLLESENYLELSNGRIAVLNY